MQPSGPLVVERWVLRVPLSGLFDMHPGTQIGELMGEGPRGVLVAHEEATLGGIVIVEFQLDGVRRLQGGKPSRTALALGGTSSRVTTHASSAGRDSLDPGGADHRVEGLVDPTAWVQQGREERSLVQFDDVSAY